MRPKGQLFDLARFRRDKKVTQKELSELLNRPQSFLSAIEHGRRSAPAPMLDELAERYKVDNITDYLSDPPDAPDFGDVKDVHDAIVNSPGGLILMNQLDGKMSQDDVIKLLKIVKGLNIAEEHREVPQLASQDSTIAVGLVGLLEKEQQRNMELEKENKELRAEVERLRNQLPKRKK